MNLGNALATLGRAAEAADSYRRAAAFRPDSAKALAGLGVALTSLHRPAEAAVYLRQAARLCPDSPRTLSLALADCGRWAEADAAYEAAFRLDPGHADAHANLGSALAHQSPARSRAKARFQCVDAHPGRSHRATS